MRLLIAEDDCVSRRVLETMLRKWGHEVVVACDGTSAWEIMQRADAPEMAILDWMMPGLDGVDVCRNIRKLDPDIRPYIILLTGRERKKDLVAGISAGADDYVIKPCEPEELKVRIRAGERILDMQREMMAAREALRYQATHDALTGLLNRASGLAALEREFSRAERTQAAVSLVLIDLDHFKEINDTYGHTVGDAVLVEATRRMASHMRPYEDLARYGGEEFLGVLAGCDLEGAARMAERVRYAMADKPFAVQTRTLSVTASFGVAASCQLEAPSQELLVNLADAALYRAKVAGRNRVECAVVDGEQAPQAEAASASVRP